jgi:hypothetical protein
MSEQIFYLCAGCGHKTADLTLGHDHAATGLYLHICPACGEKTDHWKAAPALNREAQNNRWKFIGEVTGHSWACAHCRAAHNKPFVDFAALPIPHDWQEETRQHCTHRGAGIAAVKQGRRYGGLVASQPLDRASIFRGAVIDGRNKIALEECGDDWPTLVAHIDAEVTRLEAEHETEIRALIADLHEVQQANNYKPGWVWFRIKDKYGDAIANEFLPKA